MAVHKEHHCVTDPDESLEYDDGEQCYAPGSRVTKAEEANCNRDPNQTYGDVPLDLCCEVNFKGDDFTRLGDEVTIVAPSVRTCNHQEDISCQGSYLFYLVSSTKTTLSSTHLSSNNQIVIKREPGKPSVMCVRPCNTKGQRKET